MSTSNKIISSVNAIIENSELNLNHDNVVTIDTINSRIGVGTSNPQNEIDVAGTISTNVIECDTFRSKNEVDICSFDSNISTNKTVICQNINVNTIQSISQEYINFDEDAIFNQKLIVKDVITSDDSIINISGINLEISGNDFITISNDIIKLIGNSEIELSCNNVDICCNMLIIDGSASILDTLDVPSFFQTSDDRLKHNEEIINNGLHCIRQLVPQKYQKTKNFKHEDFSGILNEPYILESGLIAQEVEDISDLNFCVNIGNENKKYTLNYNNIFVYGLAAIKELDLIVNDISKNQNENKTDNQNNNQNEKYETIIKNIEKVLRSQNINIEKMNNKINLLENKINNLEKNY